MSSGSVSVDWSSTGNCVGATGVSVERVTSLSDTRVCSRPLNVGFACRCILLHSRMAQRIQKVNLFLVAFQSVGG